MEGSISQKAIFQRCHQKHHYYKHERLRPKRTKWKAVRGTVLHRCRVKYLLNPTGDDWVKPILEFKNDVWDKMFIEEQQAIGSDMPDDMYRIMQGYVNLWKPIDTAKHARILKVNGVDAVELELKASIGKHTIKIVVDDIYEDDDGIHVRDCKTTEKVPNDSMRFTDVQTLTYFPVVAAHLKPLGIAPTDIEFDYMRTKPPAIPKLLKKGGLSKDKGIDTDHRTYYATLLSHGLDPRDYQDILEQLKDNMFYNRIRVPVVNKKPINTVLNDFAIVMNQIEADWDMPHHDRAITRACEWDCPYSRICFAEMSGVDTSALKAADFYVEESEEDEEYA